MGRTARQKTAILVHPRYAPREILGRGAQGVVLRVEDREAPSRALVAKIFRPGAFEPSALTGELALLARLRLPGVVRAHDLGRDERTGAPFLVEDFVPGEDAGAFVRGAADDADRNARLAAVLSGAAEALAGLHDAGFLHGDLKPAHVRMQLTEGRSRAVLLDLGAAVALRARTPDAPAVVTPGYAAPEVVAGARASPRSDLYGLGALAWAAATGAPPSEGARAHRGQTLRTLLPWMRPSLAEIIEALVEVHPLDRPESARALLARLGAAAQRTGIAIGAPPSPIGREREMAQLSAAHTARVQYVVGPSGAGKSHLARELVTRALLAGRAARLLTLPESEGAIVPRLVAFFRGDPRALPFMTSAGESPPLLLVLDGLDAGPQELAAALDAYRCRAFEPRAIEVVVTCRAAPRGADVVTLGPLSDAAFAELCAALGVTDPGEIERAQTASGGLPGWLVASLGRVPLARDVALARVKDLSNGAAQILCAISLSGGAMPEALVLSTATRLGDEGQTRAAAWIGELLSASLIDRRVDGALPAYALSSPALARDLAAALATRPLADAIAEVWLDNPSAPVEALLCVASAEPAPSRREDLLERAARAARARGLDSLEMKALLALAADPGRRGADLLRRLERLVRDAGMPGAHPEVLRWLDEAADKDARLLPLALRRQAEARARAGEAAAATGLAQEALEAARRAGDRAQEALAQGTLGLVALFSASFTEAEVHLVEARAILAQEDAGDPEEIARIEHNAGVVALYRGRVEEAIETFSRSLREKRRLGDRAGMRSCLMNLGMALGRAARYAEASAALEEATRLAQSLGQEAGLGWCLFARAEVELSRGERARAERFVAEARAIGAALPRVVRADLSILQARIRALEGDGEGALAAVAEVAEEVRADDALVDVRARIAEADAHLATLPLGARRAARVAIGAVRRAREASLAEGEVQARDALRRALIARGGGTSAGPDAPPLGYALRMAGDEQDQALWGFLAAAAGAGTALEAALHLARLVVRRAGAERAFVLLADAGGGIVQACGADLDGLAIGEAERRIDAGLALSALGHAGPLHQRDVATAGGRGARLAAAGPERPEGRAIVIAEHRFRPGCFDAIPAAEVTRWATLATLAFRIGGPKVGTKNDAPEPEREEGGLTPGRGAGGGSTILPVVELRGSYPGIVGSSPALRRALARLEAAIGSDLPVLLIGETGVGKEVFARALHELGPRGRRPFVAMNCGAVSDALFEAELYGHARGAFTGAERARPGLIAQAEGGTLFFDEIGELPLARQASLLRALETRRYRAVGSDEERAFDTRIVAATNRDLELAVNEKSFRQDLFFRLNAITIELPPLRERGEDMPALARWLLERAGSRAEIAEDALEALGAYEWPGNVRELRHLVERLAALGVARIERAHLPRAIRARSSASAAAGDPRAPIRRALLETGGNISRAAEMLGLTRQGLKKRMVRLGMREPPSSSRERAPEEEER
jgi:MoxR-like ATPase/tetratricopeptide (TPR) repeat protein